MFSQVSEAIENIQKIGFGEVRVLVKNGEVYRILTTADKLIKGKRVENI